MKNILTLGTLAFAMAVAAPTTAQNQVDIGLFRNGDNLEVHVRPQSTFNGIFSSVVFTIRWGRSSGASLGTLTQEGAAAQYIPLMRSGGLREEGSFNYYVYAGFGISPLESLETGWTAGEEYVIATIPVTGKGEFELLNDAWTSETANNANYYVSLGGLDRTGIIFKGLVTADEDGTVNIQPNPNQGQFTFSFRNAEPMDIKVEVLNTLGQSVFTDTVSAFEGTYRREMDITAMSNGIYYLKIKRGGTTSVHKIVYH